MDNGSSQADNDSYTPQNPYDLTSERSNSNFDVRHRFVLSSVYELPFGKGRYFWNSSRLANVVAEGWQVTTILSLQTGLPFTPVLSFDPANTGTTARPNRIADGSLADSQRSPQNWYNASAFVTPASYQYGNLARDILSGPGQRNIDVGLSRTVFFRERYRLELREAFNLFNTPQLGPPNPTLGVAATGSISTGVNPQRELQLALRLAF